MLERRMRVESQACLAQYFLSLDVLFGTLSLSICLSYNLLAQTLKCVILTLYFCIILVTIFSVINKQRNWHVRRALIHATVTICTISR